jgi:hypothetical protein
MEQRMQQPVPLIGERMKTPRAAAIAGILFSILLTLILVLLRISVQAASQETRAWPAGAADTVMLALNLVLLLVSSQFVNWLGLAFPLWVFVLSAYILVENLRGPSAGGSTNQVGESI